MENSSLSLTVEKGPRKGESVECKPGTQTRIGRVVRGNTFTIKDSAISQKHLSIELVGDGTRWAVTDHDTSNGTFLNDVQIQPSVPTDLHNGDVIKIGDVTSISVRISKVSPEPEEAPLRRYPRRKGVAEKSAPAASSVSEQVAVKEMKKVTDLKKGRGAPKRTAATRVSKRGLDHDVSCSPLKTTENEGLIVADYSGAAIDAEKSEGLDSNAVVGISRDEPLRVENDSRVTEEEVLGAEREEEGGKIEEMNANMEQMTLGEWFSQMEWYLPKVINDISEEVISDIREKSKRLNEFIEKRSDAG